MVPGPRRIIRTASRLVPTPSRVLTGARRRTVRALTTAEDLPVIGRVARPVSQLGMRLLFDGLAGRWDQIRSDPAYTQGFTEALRMLPKGFRPRQVLDSACGTGLATGLVLERWPGIRVTGTDISPRMVQLASEAFPDAAFQAASVHALPFEDGRFDLVVTLDGMLDIGELLRVLHRKGRLLIVYSNGGTTPISRPVEDVARIIAEHGGRATVHTDATAHVVVARHAR